MLCTSINKMSLWHYLDLESWCYHLTTECTLGIATSMTQFPHLWIDLAFLSPSKNPSFWGGLWGKREFSLVRQWGKESCRYPGINFFFFLGPITRDFSHAFPLLTWLSSSIWLCHIPSCRLPKEWQQPVGCQDRKEKGVTNHLTVT